MRFFCTLVFFLASYSLCSTEVVWTLDKIINVKQFSDLQLSPDNQFAAYVVSEPSPDQSKDLFLSKIYISATQNPKNTHLLCSSEPLTSQPKWSPDGKWISFISNQSGTNNLYMICTQGGDVIALTHAAASIETYRWSPDSQHIVFMMPEKLATDATNLSTIYEKEQSINRLWVIDIDNPQPKRLTNDDYYVRAASEFGNTFPEYDWSPDGKTIVFAYVPGSGCGHHCHTSSLATIDLASGKITSWEKKNSLETLPIFSPDGQWVAYVTSDGCMTLSRQVAIRSADGKQFKLLAPTDDSGIFYAGYSLLGWSFDGKHVLFFEPKGTKFRIMFLPIDGRPGYSMAFDDLIYNPALSPDGKSLIFVLQNSTTAPEAYITSLEKIEPKRISYLNQVYADLPTPSTEVIQWNSKDDLKIEGLVTYPLGYQEGKKYPLLVEIHGGPMGFFNEDFIGNAYNIYPRATFAELGFIIFRPNPRGSCGYGIDFRNALIEDLGGGDWNDVVTGIEALDQRGIIDKERMGIMGWSYGGYMTAWAIGHTHIFKAASAGGSYCDLVSFDGTTDSTYILKDYLRGTFFDKESLYRRMSPIYYMRDVTTPCLIQHGVLDQRVPVSQAYELYHALHGQGKTVTLQLFPTMHHFPTTPKTTQEAMKANLDWFIKYLQNTDPEKK